MSIDQIVMAFAGIVILSSLGLAHYLENANWLWLTTFVGFNIFQSALTGFCPLAIIVKKLGAKPGLAFK